MLKTPTVHLNGTSREELLMQLKNAYYALGKTIEAVYRAAPHGRDYYPQGDDAINEAIKEHKSRLERLSSVRDELMTIWESI